MSNKVLIEDKIVMKKLNEIKPYIRNPRKNDKTVEMLVKIIPKVGFNVPIVIDENGVIIKGHARYMAAIKLKLEKVPCIVSHADPEAIKADRIADNKISEFSEWINDELMHEIDMINFDIDFGDLGFAVDSGFNFDDFDYSDDEISVTPEEKAKLYEQFIQEQNEEKAKIVSDNDIVKAQKKQSEIAKAPRKYYKFRCSKCGAITYVTEGNFAFEEDDE